MQTGKYRLAEFHFRRAVEINPTNATLVCCIGSVSAFFLLFLPHSFHFGSLPLVVSSTRRLTFLFSASFLSRFWKS